VCNLVWCDCDLFEAARELELDMSNSHFAQQAFETDYPVSSGAPKVDDPFAAAFTLDLELSAVLPADPAGVGRVRCEPPEDHRVHVFHWLVFAAPSLEGKGASAGCDLWRWHRGEWRSVFVAGATFTPEEMYAQGWRYCAPSVQLFVKIVSKAKHRHGDSGQSEARPKHPVGSGSPTMQPKRNRRLALAVPAPAWPRPAGPLRRAAWSV
jgi:hypothetical protein